MPNIFYKTEDEVSLIRHSCQLVGQTHAAVVPFMKPGVTTARLDQIAEEFIKDNKAVPSFKGYNGFPNTLCISVNDMIVHGIPGAYQLRDGDIVSLDCGVYCGGYHGDSAYTYCIGEIELETRNLLLTTYECLYKGVEQAICNKRIGDIGFAIQQHAESRGFSVVRELLGHGIGRKLHEEPQVPNYGKRGSGVKLLEGLVLAIEPMINMGKRDIKHDKDGWTIRTIDKKPSAHYEHTVVVRKNKAEILSTFTFLEEAVKNNAELTTIC